MIYGSLQWLGNAILFGLIQTLPVVLMWNFAVVSTIPGVGELDIPKAFVLIMLLRFLLRGWHQENNSQLLANLCGLMAQNNHLTNTLVQMTGVAFVPMGDFQVAPETTESEQKVAEPQSENPTDSKGSE
jgi:hypothetical protein